jgi:uncharacterized protein (TIGR00299 family) protein
MFRLAYLDCSSGISGDMFLGALLDAGVGAENLAAQLHTLPLSGYDWKHSRVARKGLMGTRVEVVVGEPQPHRHLHQIEQALKASGLSEWVKTQAIAIFQRLASAEGWLHGKPPGEVHFHEVGAVDAMVDIAGACIGMELLGRPELVCSPLNLGAGRVEAAHGSLPVPAPATMELLKGVPVYSTGIEAELVTPTGAAIVSTLAARFGPFPAMKVERIGYGAGARDLAEQPNLLRLFVGEPSMAAHPGASTPSSGLVSVIEADVDDMSPQIYGYVIDRALAAGALDVTCTSIQMKKNRPGIEIRVLAPPDRAEELADLLFRETTTIGVRIYEARRKCLDREWVAVETEFGPVRVKVAQENGRVLNVAPEYDDCQRLAVERSVPLKQVMLAAQWAYRKSQESAPGTRGSVGGGG